MQKTRETQKEIKQLLVKKRLLEDEIELERLDNNNEEVSSIESLRSQLAVIERKIKDIKSSTSSKVELSGKKVVLQKGGSQITYDLVNPAFIDPGRGKISVSSPIAEAVKNSKVGGILEVSTPRGIINYKLLSLS